jgi:transposase-like protein
MTTRRYSPEVRERAVGMMLEHEREYQFQWGAMVSIAEKIGCSVKALRRCVQRVEVDTGQRGGITSDERTRITELEREVRELRRANEILLKASAFFAQAELDRLPKRQWHSSTSIEKSTGSSRSAPCCRAGLLADKVAPSTYYEQKARQVDPSRLPQRTQRDAVLCKEINRV